MSSELDNNKKLKDFFGQEYHSLKTYVSSRIKDSVDRDAEDIIQDVALKLFSGADRYSQINNVAGFVYRSLRNKIIDIMRTNKNVYNHDESEDKLQELAEIVYEVSDEIYSDTMKEVLKAAIMGLKKDYRDIIIAVDFEGYTYKEIAFETRVPEGTLMSRRHRAISLLHKELKTKIDINKN